MTEFSLLGEKKTTSPFNVDVGKAQISSESRQQASSLLLVGH